MPKIGVTKDQLEGLSNPPAGIYEVRLDNFRPKKSKPKPDKAPSINLQPQLKIVNHNSLNDKPVFTFCNTSFAVEIYDMSHAFGVPYNGEGTDQAFLQGEFQCSIHGENCDDSDPENWNYIGPLIGQVAKVELIATTGQNGQPQNVVNKWFCRVPGCTAKHRESLATK